MALQKIKLIAIAEIIIGLIAWALFFNYGSSLDKESCGFAYAIEGFFFLTGLLLVAGIPTLLFHPFGRWIHIIFSPLIALIFSGVLFFLLILTPVVRISYQLARVPIWIFFITFPVFTIMIFMLFIDSEAKELFIKKIKR